MKKLLLKSSIALTLSTYHISQTDQNLSTNLHHSDNTNPFHLQKTSSEKQYIPYPIYLSYQPDRSVSHQPDRSEPIYTSSSARLYQSIQMKQLLLKSIIALTLFTYHISQTNQNLSTHLHQPDYTNLFQMKKLLLKSNIALTLSTYHISQNDQNLSTHLHQLDYTNPIHMKNSF